MTRSAVVRALGRVVAHVGALLWAVILPTLVMCFEGGSLRLAAFIFATGLSFALAIALPAYLLLRWLGRVNVYTCVLGGFAAVAIPIGSLTWPLRYADLRTTASIDGHATEVDGVPTAFGWALYASGTVRYALLGAVGGLVFWGLLKLGGELAKPFRPSRTRVVASSAMCVLALLASASIKSIPTLTADRTCHGPNGPLQNGAGIDLAVEDTEWSALTDVLRGFGEAHRLSVRNSSEVRPSGRFLYLSICDARVNVQVNEQRWASNDFKKALAGRHIDIGLYHAAGDESWRGLAVELIRDLQARWPGAVRLVDGGGRLKPVPEPLTPDSVNREPEPVEQTK